MRTLILCLFLTVIAGVNPAFALDEPQNTAASTTTATAAEDKSEDKSADEGAKAETSAHLAAIAEKRCDEKGGKLDDKGGCVKTKLQDDENIDFRYKRTWDPLFGDEPVPPRLFNNVR